MKMYNVEKGEKYFFYVDKVSGGLSCESYGYRIKERVDEKTLIQATEKCMKLFPLFRLKPVLDEKGELFLADNDRKMPVFPNPIGKKRFGTDDTNKYLFVVCYGEYDINVFAHHSLGDGRMVLKFLTTLVFEYLTLQGYQMEANAFIASEEDLKESTILSSMLTDAFEVEIEEPKGVYVPENVYHYSQTQKQSQEKAVRIFWNQTEMMSDSKKIGVTVGAYLNAVICEAILRCDTVGNQHIVAGVPVDMRTKMKSCSHRNYIGNVRVPFLPEWQELSFEDKANKLMEQLSLQTEFSNILSRVRLLEPVVDSLIAKPLYEKDYIRPESEGNKSGIVAQTFLLTNIGRVPVPEDMLEHIENLFLRSKPNAKNIFFAPFSLGDTGSLVIVQCFENMDLINAISEVLKERGINPICENIEVLESLQLGIEDFDRV